MSITKFIVHYMSVCVLGTSVLQNKQMEWVLRRWRTSPSMNQSLGVFLKATDGHKSVMVSISLLPFIHETAEYIRITWNNMEDIDSIALEK